MRAAACLAALALLLAPFGTYAQPGDPPEVGEDGEPTGDEGEPAPAGEGGTPDAEEVVEEEEAQEEELPPPRAVDPDRAVHEAPKVRLEELARSAYTFCHDEDYEPQTFYGDQRFCKVWDQAAIAACPAARALCKDREESMWSKLRLTIPREVGWLLLASALAVALFFFIRALMKGDWRAATEIDLGAVVDEARTGELQKLPEAPSQVILRKAREALDAGSAEDAAILVQLACLRYFDDTGIIAFHPSRTNGEYLRAVRRRSAPHGELYRRIAMETDRVRFGSGVADAAVVAQCIDEGRALLTGTPPPEPAYGAPLATLLLACALGATQPGCDRDDKPFYSHRPAGMAALPATLRGLGFAVEIRRTSIAEMATDVAVVVMHTSAPRELEALAVDELLDRDVTLVLLDDGQRGAHFLPIVTGTITSSALTFAGRTLDLGTSSPAAETVYAHDTWVCDFDVARADALLGPRRLSLPQGPRYRERESTNTGTTAASAHAWAIEPMLLVEHGPREMAVGAYAGARVDKELGYHRDGCVFLFSSPDLFTNASLALPQNAAFVAGLFASITPQGRKILLLDGLREVGKTDDGIARSLADSRLLPFILQGLLWVALLFVFLGAAFGPLRDPVKVQHKAFVEHVQALGRQYARLGSAGLSHVARSLGKYLVMRHRGDVRGGGTSWASVSQHLAEKHGLPESDVRTALALGLEGVSELGPPVSDELARSENVLRALSILITGRARAPQTTKRVRRR